MRKKTKPNKKSLKIAVYFGVFVIFILITSILFKGFDLVRSSSFDGNNRFTVAVISEHKAEILTVSPSEGALSRLRIEDANSKEDLGVYQIPINSYVYLRNFDPKNTKSAFTNMLSGLRGSDTNLTVLDLFRLSLFAATVDSENLIEENVSFEDGEKLTKLSESLFIDPKINEEKATIQITNSTELQGFGKYLGQYISNLGGNVVLINSSQENQDRTKLIYTEKTYTSERLGKILNIPAETGEHDAISDIVIIIGEDAWEILNL